MKIIIKTKGGTGFELSSPEDVVLVKGHVIISEQVKLTEKKKHYAIPVSNIDFIAEQTGHREDLVNLINFITKEPTNETTDGKDKT
jgi:hypothetical protein